MRFFILLTNLLCAYSYIACAANTALYKEQRLLFLTNITPVQVTSNFCPDDCIIELANMDLVAAFKNHEEESTIHIFDYSEEIYFSTIHIEGKVCDINNIQDQIVIDIKGPKATERLWYRIINHAEFLNDAELKIIYAIQNRVLENLQQEKPLPVQISKSELTLIRNMPASVQDIVRPLIHG